MESHNIQKKLFSSLFIILAFSLLSLPETQAVTADTIQRTTKQQLLASLHPSKQTSRETAGASQSFLTSSSGRYEAYLMRRETAPGAGGFGNDFCYIQVQESGNSVWESECAPVSNDNACSLAFTDAGLEIFDGSRSSWDTDADGDHLETLVLLDSGDMQIREHGGDLAWKASEHPLVNQNCGSIGSPGLASEHPPFASPIPGSDIGFGQPSDNQSPFVNQNQPPSLVTQHGEPTGLQDQEELGDQQPIDQKPPFGRGFSGSTSAFGGNGGALVDNTPFDSGVSKEMVSKLGIEVSVAVGFVGYVFLM